MSVCPLSNIIVVLQPLESAPEARIFKITSARFGFGVGGAKFPLGPWAWACGRHVNAKDEHVKDAAQNAAQDVAGHVPGAAEDGGIKVLILPIAIFQRRNPRPTHVFRPPRLPCDT